MQNQVLHSRSTQSALQPPGQRGISTCPSGTLCDLIWASGCRALILQSGVLGRLRFFLLSFIQHACTSELQNYPFIWSPIVSQLQQSQAAVMLAQSTCGIPVERITKPSNDLIQLLKHPRAQAVLSKPADWSQIRVSSKPKESSDPGLLSGLNDSRQDLDCVSETSATNKDESTQSFLQPISCLSHELAYCVNKILSFTYEVPIFLQELFCCHQKEKCNSSQNGKTCLVLADQH